MNLVISKLRNMDILKLFSLIFSLLCLAFIGWYFGYISGARNQIHFDAVGRVLLYEAALSSTEKEARSMLKVFHWKQKCLLANDGYYDDFNYDTYTIYHPIHSEVLDFYEKYRSSICANNICECPQFDPYL